MGLSWPAIVGSARRGACPQSVINQQLRVPAHFDKATKLLKVDGHRKVGAITCSARSSGWFEVESDL